MALTMGYYTLREKIMKTDTWALPLFLASLGGLAAILYLAGRPALPPDNSPPRMARSHVDATLDYASPEFAWRATVGTGGKDFLVRGRLLDRIRGNVEQLLHAVNRSGLSPDTLLVRSPDMTRPVFRLDKVASGTVSVTVLNPTQLTSRMGSTGALAALAEATYTLTEYPGVHAVIFDFPEGDHAEPGRYTRQDFVTIWQVLSTTAASH